ncbi:cysteine hydrolase [Rhodococcus sp. IEGM 1379]|uniref:cysteine hydrolase family protein n=1 Tax=Rhodococcus sp. IEGM 1379 TaxID=3047086 RepID=UPI0024B8302C|nr:cysteine hydrolase [Rhodococcus sp. IEGM 1379]MDI9916835.1 cysteine hydrolase [Rhodococcus sp. IEGM 1379]
MHNNVIDPVIRARYTAMKGGREFAYDTLDPARTAHLVIDMQNGFVEDGALLAVTEARNIVANINAVSEAVRSHGGTNIFFRFTTTSTNDWSSYFEKFQSTEFGRAEVAEFRSGTHNWELHPDIDVADNDIVLDKIRFSAFATGSSSAMAILADRGIDTVIVSGTLTDCCCATTAQDAHQLGFRVVFLDDATAALSDNEHNAAINTLAAWFADIRHSEHVVSLIGGA